MSFEFQRSIAFEYQRTIRLADTNATGAIDFTRGLTFCHEAYEASLEAMGIEGHSFFAPSNIAVPIIHAEIDLRGTVACREVIVVRLSPQLLDPHSFEVTYRITSAAGHLIASALTRHVCLERSSQQRCALLPELTRWLQQFSETSHSVSYALTDAPPLSVNGVPDGDERHGANGAAHSPENGHVSVPG
jgi:1,4-dihydroxy-2-naphthoyl-CoA hydrolase